MKKALAYTILAVLLGVTIMLTPYKLSVSEMGLVGETKNEAKFLKPLSGDRESMFGLLPAPRPDILFIAFMLVFSFVLALGVMRYSMRKLFSNI